MGPRRDGEVEPGTWNICIECDEDWFLADGQKKWFAARGWVVPRRCEACRTAKRERQREHGAA
jgi:hypothetical protein